MDCASLTSIPTLLTIRSTRGYCDRSQSTIPREEIFYSLVTACKVVGLTPFQNTKKTSIVLCIDVEPDVREVTLSGAKDWLGLEETFDFFNDLRPRLEDATGERVSYSWFLRMDPQITLAFGSPTFVTTRYGRFIESLRKVGDEIGLHVHAWRWQETNQGWITDLADQAWIDHCVISSFEAFQEAMGQTCRSVRFGDRWMNNETIRLFQKLGARFDLSVEPATIGGTTDISRGRFTGSLPDLGNVPRRPYQPSKNDFRREALMPSDDFYILPLSCPTLGRTSQQSVLATSNRKTKSNLVFEGSHDSTDCRAISGWAWCKSRPNVPINVDIYDRENLIATVTANMFRPDLLEAGKGEGYHAFEFPVLNSLKDGELHDIYVKFSGTSLNVNSTPRTIQCDQRADATVEHLTLNLSYNAAVICHALDQTLSTGGTDYLGMVVRSDTVIRSPQRSNLDAIVAHIARHPMVGQFVFESPGDVIERLGV